MTVPFVSSAKSRSFWAFEAAEVLNVTKGAISCQIKAPEDDLGLIQFERIAHGVSLTRNGCLECARKVPFEHVEADIPALTGSVVAKVRKPRATAS